MDLRVFNKKKIDSNAYSEVERIGNSLFNFCKTNVASEGFAMANSPGYNSAKVQDVFLGTEIKLGFQSEKKK